MEIHKAYQIGGVDALPKRYDRTIFLTGKHDKEKGRNPNDPAPSSAGTRALPGVACAQAGELEDHEVLKEHGKGIETLIMAQCGGGGANTLMHHVKALVCLNPKCGDNHYLRDCTKTSDL